mmetsp:Transcript_64041/g.171518  ORF Transcript_64041/g.171518 Transcript_64041/m.171518 type:complete len:83 (-) Transcript_64041:980-1228(-)
MTTVKSISARIALSPTRLLQPEQVEVYGLRADSCESIVLEACAGARSSTVQSTQHLLRFTNGGPGAAPQRCPSPPVFQWRNV